MHTTNYTFTEEYNKLNPAQKKAVELTEGPVMVIAGPGTGKTQILATRIANILDKGLAFGENILCLTFTDAGANAMRKRLINIIGSEAYKVNIHTFHSFCNQVIQDNNELFGLKDLEPISEIEEIQLFENLIDNFDKDSPLKRWRGSIYYDRTRLKNLFSIMKKENLSPLAIENAVKEAEKDFLKKDSSYYKKKTNKNDGSGEYYEIGDLKEKDYAEFKAKIEPVLAAAKEFENYEKLKTTAGRYDYDDMILNVLKAFQNNESLLSKYQEQFHYFLVDEFQDTSGSQFEIVNLLCSYWEQPNLFVVGDDDQSIYRFQGASMENIVDFYQKYLGNLAIQAQKNRVIVLEYNYRSSQIILDLAHAAIQHNEMRLVNQLSSLGLVKELSAKGDFADTSIPTIINEYPNVFHETAGIALQIQELLKTGVKASEIAVLYNQHKQSQDLIQCLQHLNIPIFTKKPVNILNEPFSMMLFDLMIYLYDEQKIAHSREDLLFQILLYPFFDVSPLQVARLSFELRESRYKQPKTTWREALRKIELVIDQNSVDNIEKIILLIDKWQQDAVVYPIQQFLQILIDDLQIINYIQKNERKVWLMQELKTLFDFVKQVNKKDPKLKLNGFIQILNQHQNYEINIPYMQSTYQEDAVQFLSLHGSKGLEFEYVFIMGCVSSKWDKKRKNNNSFYIPETLMSTTPKEHLIEDLRRLFFVGITRAKKQITISYYNENEEQKQETQSLFVTEINESGQAKTAPKTIDDETLLNFLAFMMQGEKPQPALIEEHLLKNRLDNYAMSVTHLNNYLNCPLKFYYHNFIQIPQAKSSSFAFGSAVHDALENLFTQMLANNKVFPSSENFVEMGIKALYKQQDSFTDKEYQQKKAYIENFFPQLYKDHIETWCKDVALEKKLEAVFKGLPLNGRLDKINFYENNHVSIVDYKTGKFDYKKEKYFKPPASNFKDPNKPTFEEKYGGSYWRQAVFYKILLKYNVNSFQKDWILDSTIFELVEPEAKTNRFKTKEIKITPEHLAIVENQIETTWKNIQALNFEGCGEEDCEFCNGQIGKLLEE